MKRKWHIKTRIMATLMGLTCSMLLVVALVFNLSIQGFIRSRLSDQLDRISKNASEELKDAGRGPRDNRTFDEQPDRITGTRGNAIELDGEGKLLNVIHGDKKTGTELAEHFASRDIKSGIQNEVVSVDSGTYAVNIITAPNQNGRYLLTYVDITSLMAFSRQINLMLFIVILAAVLLSVLLSLRFSRLLSGPVRDLSDFAKEIGNGNLDAREMNFADIEFDDLVHSMNDMASQLREAKQTQETFFQNMSHELRTPLTSIRGNAEGIVYGVMEPQNAAKVILSESDKLSDMVEDILFLSRMGKATQDGVKEPLDLREVLSLCVSEQRTAADNKGISFSFDFDEDPVMLMIPRHDAERLFGNLLSNAIRYADSAVILSCHFHDDAVVVLIADDGPGVSDEDLPHVFERFYKGKDGQHGIGLAIARSVTESCHGSLTVHNNGGAVFEARFPRE